MKQILIIILVLVGSVFLIRFVFGGSEDTWICQNSEWVKHGNPKSSKPILPCGGKVTACQNISEEKAIEIVGQQPDVLDFQAQMDEKSEKVKFISNKGEENDWVVQVAEDLPDHLATLNFYSVNICTGQTKAIVK
jgi:hypothetical protein